MIPHACIREICMQTLCRSQSAMSSAISDHRPFVWVICASISLLSARHLLVERNMHYPLQLYFNQLIFTAILMWRPRLAWRCVQELCPRKLKLWRLMTRGTALLVVSVCCTSLSTICILQATLHFYNLPVLAMITLIAFFAEDLLLYTTRVIPRTNANLLRISLLVLASTALVSMEYRLTVPNLVTSIVAMLLAGSARGLRKLVTIHHPHVSSEREFQASLHLIISALVGVVWVSVFETGNQILALDFKNIPLLALNAAASAIAMLLGNSVLLPVHGKTAGTFSRTINALTDRPSDAVSLTLLTGIVGCYSTLLTARSYTNIYQFCCFLLTVVVVGSSSCVCASVRYLRTLDVTSSTYELLSSPAALSAEESDTVSLTEEANHSAVMALKSSSTNNTFSRYLSGIVIALLWMAYGILNFTERQERRGPVLLDRDYVPQLPVEIVLSMYKEPINEVRKLVNHLKSMPTFSDAHVTIYIKDSGANNSYVKQQTGAHNVTTLPNVGREGETFLKHILDRWHDLARHTIFLQAGIHNPREFYTHVSNYYDRAQTGFFNLGWPGRLCDHEDCSDRFGWQDSSHFIPQICKQMYNSTNCGQVLLSYKGQFIVSAARIRGINKDIYYGLWQAFVDENSLVHQPNHLQGRPDSMSAPDFGYTMERLWNLLFQCSSVDVGWKCPTLVSRWRLGGDISDCQCFDT